MSTSNNNWRWTYEPNGVTPNFGFDNLVLSADELIVKWWSAAGTELALPAHSVTGLGNENGGEVVFDSPPATTAGSLLEIIRKTTPQQETEFEDFIQESAAARQERSDRQFLLAQELRGLLDRALLFSPLDPAGPFRIPAPSVRANKALMFGAGPLAQLTVGSPLAVGSLVVSAFVETLLDDNDADTFLGSLGFSAFVKSLKAMVDGPAFRAAIGAVDASSIASFPQGRLSLASGVREMNRTAYTGKTVLYYTGGIVPIWSTSAGAYVPTLVGELQNDITLGTAGAGPAAAGPYQAIDGFVWNDSGTPKLTRGPKWRKSSTVTMTLATPTVIEWPNHGLYDGATFRLSTTGALYTGLAVATDYFATVVDADHIKASTTLANQVAGTYIATSGAQAGVHTGENYTTARGAGAGTCEIEWLNGIPVNRYAIVNGPAAREGTFVGTVLTDASSQMNWQPGGLAVGGTSAILGVWNMFNRADMAGVVQDSTVSWSYNSSTVRPARAQAGMRVTGIVGMPAIVKGRYTSAWQGDLGVHGCIGIGVNSITAMSDIIGRQIALNTATVSQHFGEAAPVVFGAFYLAALEVGNVSFTMTIYQAPSGSNGPGQLGISYSGRF